MSYKFTSGIATITLDEVTDSQQLLARCSEIATELLELPTESYAVMKRDVRQGSLAKIHASIH